MRIAWVVFSVALSLSIATAPHRVALGQEPLQDQIRSWARELQDERFAVREAAQSELERNLAVALPELIEIAESSQNQKASGLLQFLGMIAQDALSDQGKSAYECLTRISNERTTERAILAQKILQCIAVQMREKALGRLERVGVVCADRNLSVLTQLRDVKNALVIDRQFSGTQDDLALLPWLFDVQFVKLEGPSITPSVLEQVVKLPQLRSLQIIETSIESQDLRPLLAAPDMDLIEILYSPVDDQCIKILENVPIFGDLQLFGTEVSASGAEQLIAAIETANVFVGRGGFLGITCEPSSLIIQESIPKGPAEKAGIRMGDKLKKINGVPIYNFEDLRKQLAKSAAGESVLVEFDRPIWKSPEFDPIRGPRQKIDGYETLKVDVILGKRTSDLNR